MDLVIGNWFLVLELKGKDFVIKLVFDVGCIIIIDVEN